MREKKKILLLSRYSIYFNMKYSRFILIFIFFIGVFYSCSTDVDLYADYKDVPIIYAMLDSRADTNYVKITRAFCGTNDNPIDANEVALIYDSSNYPGKLDARIYELKNTYSGAYEVTGRIIELDTMTIHDKLEGVFYAPDQMVYYTTEPFNANTESNKYKYRLVVVKPDGDTLTASTNMVGNEEFSIMSAGVNFQLAPTGDLGRIFFRADGTAALYEVAMQFNYWEQLAGHEMKQKHIRRTFGTRTIDQFINTGGNSYYLEYSQNWLFNTLALAIGGDTIVDPEHPNVVRYVDDFVISISAAGEDLYYYYTTNQAQLDSPVGFVSIYSNIKGGYGLFSSRTTVKRVVNLSKSTKYDLYGKTSWGFQEQ